MVAKLQGDTTAPFGKEIYDMSGREVIQGDKYQHPNLPWNFITHERFLDPIHASWFFLSKKGSRHSNDGWRNKNTTA